MARFGWMKVATFSAALVFVAPTVALACEAHQKASAEQAKADPAKAENEAGKKGNDEGLHADKCDCSGPADCTCKKGKCKCTKCKKRHDGRQPASNAEV